MNFSCPFSSPDPFEAGDVQRPHALQLHCSVHRCDQLLKKEFPPKHSVSHPGLGDNGASIPLQVLDFDENSNQVANSLLGKDELAEAISGEESGYSSLG